jgi:hypothetical protein
MSLHSGIWLTMYIGIFPWVSALCMVCFLPSWFWDRSAAILRSAFPGLPDVARRLERAGAHLIHAYWAPLQSHLPSMVAGASRRPAAGLAAHGGSERREDHTTAAMAHSPTVTLEQGETRPAAEARQGAQRDGSGPPMLRSSLVTNLLAAFFLLYVFCWNLTTVSSFTMPERLASIGPFLGVSQEWNMFAPFPAKDGGWYVIPGTLRGGQQVDLMSVVRDDFSMHEVSWEKPQHVAGIYGNQHWRKYMDNLYEEDYSDLRLHFGRYLCREWNDRHAGSEQLMNFDIIYMLEVTLPDYRRATPEKVVTWEHSCV